VRTLSTIDLMIKVAILYDFDKTLSTKDMQEFGFLEALGFTQANDFWKLCALRAKSEQMDPILAYLYEILVQAKRQGLTLSRAYLNGFAKQVLYYPGVETWFARLNQLAMDKEIVLEHYILSSGLKEIIETSTIAPFIKKIYACEYLYQEGVAVWPKLSINYTLKTQFLFRINKGVLEISEDEALNRYQAESERPIPFQNMIYIGDGLTDVPSMKLVKMNGGHAIGVYPKGHRDNTISQQLLQDQRVDFIAEADYQSGSKLEGMLLSILESVRHENK